MTGDFHAFLRTRRTIRQFSSEPVPQDVLRRILETAQYAPSAHNKQPWRFAVVQSSSLKKKLGAAITGRFRRDSIPEMGEQELTERIERTLRRTGAAPVVIVLCHDSTQVDIQPDAARQQIESAMGMQSVAAAGLQLLLAAHAEGLGGGWICWALFTPEEVRAALELPASWDPQALFFLGYAAEQPQAAERLPFDQVVRFL